MEYICIYPSVNMDCGLMRERSTYLVSPSLREQHFPLDYIIVQFFTIDQFGEKNCM